ncbi:MAG: ATP-dependent zinc protease family protein [Planctomycetota bacterium]|jgi:hypothetical protein
MLDGQRAASMIIGWREFVAFPVWDVKGIEAKIDTGARTSAIHVEDVVRLKGDRVRFHLVTNRRKPFKHVAVTADLVRTTRVRSSTGHSQERYVIATTVRIGSIRRRVEMSLVGRDKMLCRMLLGRTAMEGFLIDPTARYLQGKPKYAGSKKKVKP